jgi:hypothetical protein
MKYGKVYNSFWEQTLSYLSDKLTNLERNTFERELERDPFEAEAQEGFSLLSHDELSGDLTDIETEINSRIAKFSIWKLAIAATLLVIIGISTFFYLQNRNEPGKFTRNNIKKEAPATKVEKTKPKLESIVPSEPEAEETIPQTDTKLPVSNNKPDTVVRQKSKKVEPVLVKKEEPKSSTQKDSALTEKIADVQPETITVPDTALNNNDALSPEVETSETDLNRPAITDTSELQQAEQNNNNETESIPEDSPALPVAGEKAFQEYLKSSATLDNNSEFNRKTVRLIVIVSETGTAESIIVYKSGGNEIDNKAKQLLLESSGWHPAIKDGKSIKDTLDLRIVFKKE